jgi:hypothetical protein
MSLGYSCCVEISVVEMEFGTEGGDTLPNGRYETVHKLGLVAYWTVWLAKDKQLQR